MSGDPYDPFVEARAEGPVVEGQVGEQVFPMVIHHRELKRVARDCITFTSNAPFRIPIPEEQDVRSVAQLPIESDPPLHGAYRDMMEPAFSRRAMDRHRASFVVTANALLDPAIRAGEFDVVGDFAMPLFLRALAITLGRPEHEADEWGEWGTEVFTTDPETERRVGNRHLDTYLERVTDEAMRDGSDCFFGHLAKQELNGRPLTREEILGFGILAFAGGRQTVVYTMANITKHLALHDDDFRYLKSDNDVIPRAVEEFLRFMTPITHIGRVATQATELGSCPVLEDSVVSLCFAAANRDEAVFEHSDVCDLTRWPNRHVAFGHGPHTCLGAPMARSLLVIVLETFCARITNLELRGDEDPRYEEIVGVGEALQGYTRLGVRLA